MQRDDAIRLRHMLDAAREAMSFATGRVRSDLDTDRQLVLALVKSLEIVGEAASRVSPECRTECSEIPWADIVGMRNRLIHAYFDINLEIVWRTVSEELPVLGSPLPSPARVVAGDHQWYVAQPMTAFLVGGGSYWSDSPLIFGDAW